MVINVGKKNEPDIPLDFDQFPAAYHQTCILLGHHPTITSSFIPHCASYPCTLIISATLALTSAVFETTAEPALQRHSSILFQRPHPPTIRFMNNLVPTTLKDII